MQFKDHFSSGSGDYARHRPGYPPALFSWLAAQAPATRLAWDCATGNGQAALGLAAHFDGVIATDASREQIAAAAAHPAVEYRVAPAEESGIDGGSADLVTAAQALHWFDVQRFYAEAERVLKPGGVLAVWNYGLARVSPAVDAIVARLYGDIVGEHWPPERRHIETGYRDLGFPWPVLGAPDFEMRAEWRAGDMLAYLRTWSASKRYREATGSDPVAIVEEALGAAWGAAPRRVIWPLTLLAGAAPR